jgi:predicted dehydrogenase
VRGSGPLRIVQVGAGLWGRSWAELIAHWRGSELVGLVDSSAEARTWAHDALGVPAFTTLRAALSATDGEAVLLVSPPGTHRRLAEEALAAGCHVVIEKPVSTGYQDAVAVARAADERRRHVVVSQNYRFRRQTRALQRLVRDGALGPLAGIRIVFRRDLRRAHITPGDWRGRMPHPLLLDMAIHHVDLLRAVSGRDVLSVDARSWPAPDGPFRHEPTVAALIELQRGLSASYDGSWAPPYGETSWNGDWELIGGAARATWTGGLDDPLTSVVRVERFGERPRRTPLPRLAVLDRLGVIAELRRAIRAGDEPEVGIADNLRTLAAVLALARSCDERRPVEVAEVTSA